MVSTSEPPGAKESNAGDEFHILWAVNRALQMLNPRSDLELIVMEGLSPIDSVASNPSLLLGADLTEYYGGSTFSGASRIVVSQLKHSHRQPHKAWTASRLAQLGSRKQDGVIKRLADLFRHFVEVTDREQVIDKLSIRLVSNQPISAGLHRLLTKVAAVLQSSKRPQRSTLVRGLTRGEVADFDKLQAATKLGIYQFGDFLRVLSLDELGANPRWEQWNQITATLGRHILTAPTVGTRALFELVRRQALPDADELRLTREAVLAELGAPRHSSLFPLPNRIKVPPKLITSPDVIALGEAIIGGAGHVVAHGDAGVGKTTTIATLEGALPSGSVVVEYDCFGNGEYLSPTETRHLARPALTQLINEIALRCGTPILIPGTDDEHVLWRRFGEVLVEAGASLANAGGHLVIAVDAADNAIVAGRNREQATFLPDLWLLPLPDRVHILMTSRTHRRASIAAPPTSVEVNLRGFDSGASSIHLRGRFPSAAEEHCVAFHRRTGGNPRSQFYVLDASRADAVQTVEAAVAASDTTPHQIFEDLVVAATRESANPESAEQQLADLISLSRPVSIATFAGASGVDVASAAAFCHGLVPGVVIDDGTVWFRDEDFETHLRDRVPEAARAASHARLAAHFMAERSTDAEAALACAEHLWLAGRSSDLLRLAVDEGQPSAITDPVARLQSYLRRLELALRVAQGPDNRSDVIKLLLLAAKASTFNQAVTAIVRKRPDLAIRYGDATAVAAIYEGSHTEPWRGPLHLRVAALRARAGDRTAAEEELRLALAWLQRWSRVESDESNSWSLEAADVAAGAEAIYLLRGVAAASAWITFWQPREFAMDCAVKLVESLASTSTGDALATDVALLSIPSSLKANLLAILFEHGASPGETVVREIAEGALDNPSIKPRDNEWVASFAELIASATHDEDLLRRWAATFSPRVPSHAPSEWTGLGDWEPLTRVKCLLAIADGGRLQPDDLIPTFMQADPADTHKEGERKEQQRRQLMTAMETSLDVLLARATTILTDVTVAEIAEPIERRIQALKSARQRGGGPDLTRHWTPSAIDALSAARGDATATITAVFDGVWARNAELGIRLTPILARRLIIHGAYRPVALNWLDRAARATVSSKAPASERVDRLLEITAIVDRYEPNLATGYYEAAVTAADGLDDEGAGVLRVHATLAHTTVDAGLDLRAAELAERTIRALERYRPFVTDTDRLPWKETAAAVATLHPPSGLALLSRWEHQGLLSLDAGVRVIVPACSGRFLPPGKALSLLLLANAASYPIAVTLDLLTVVQESGDKSLLHRALGRTCTLIGRDIPSSQRVRTATKVQGWATRQGLRETSPIRDLTALLDFVEQLPRPTGDGRQRLGQSKTDEPGIVLPASKHTLSEVGSSLDELCDKWASDEEIESFLEGVANSISPTERADMLRGLATVPADHALWRSHAGVVLSVISKLVDRWSLTVPVRQWVDQELPRLIKSHMQSFIAYEHTIDATLAVLLSMASLADPMSVLVESLAPTLRRLDPPQLHAVVRALAVPLSIEERLAVLEWSVARFEETPVRTPSIPCDPNQAVAWLLFSLFGHPDKAVRWRAAHAARELLTDDEAMVLGVWGLWDKKSAGAFGPDSGTFLRMSAQTWMLAVIDRVAAESPNHIVPIRIELAEIALDRSFPHVACRELARRSALRLLDSQSLGSEDFGEYERLLAANRPSSCAVERGSVGRGGSFDTRDNARFRFNGLDTVPYWFGPLAGIFAIGQDDVCGRVESWIVDRLHFNEDAASTDPWALGDRYTYTERQNDHGALPRVEDLHTYLEYHGMLLAAGELVDEGRPIVVPTWDDPMDPWADWLDEHVTDSMGWTVDERAPAPITAASFGHVVAREQWRDRIPEDFDQELGLDCYPTAIVVSGYRETFLSDRHENAWVASALVSPKTSSALLSALQTCLDPTDFRLPEEADWEGFEIDDEDFRLVGWIRERRRDQQGLDKHDPLRRIDRAISMPGTLFAERLDVRATRNGRELIGKDDERVAWAEQWSDVDDSKRAVSGGVTTQGRQTRVALLELLNFLQMVEMDVIFEVRIQRQYNRTDHRTDEEDRERYERGESRIYLLRRGGQLETLGGSRQIGAVDSPATGTRKYH